MLPRFIGMRRATEMLLTGEPIGAQQAADWGLINRVVAPERLEEEVAELAGRLATGATVAIGAVKTTLTRGWNLSVEEGYNLSEFQNARAGRAEDAAEGRAAFRERREPAFTGR
jgi:2-(1,2-epoxy-1,2-dihydrophenyl)acetyl-CoA isomerase